MAEGGICEGYADICFNVFRHHLIKLLNISDLDSLLMHFEEREIINVYQHIEIKDNTSPTGDKIQMLLDNISLPLEGGYTKKFDIMLEILKCYGTDDTKRIACAMQIEVEGFVQLRIHYNSLENCMPEDFIKTTHGLSEYLTDAQIKDIINSEDSQSANKLILQILTEKLSCADDLHKLCAQLESISTSPSLNMLINDIKSSMKKIIESNTDVQSSHLSTFETDSRSAEVTGSSQTSVHSTYTQSISVQEHFSSRSFPQFQLNQLPLLHRRNVEEVENDSSVLDSLRSSNSGPTASGHSSEDNLVLDSVRSFDSIDTETAVSETMSTAQDYSSLEIPEVKLPYFRGEEISNFWYVNLSPYPSLPTSYVRRDYLLGWIANIICFGSFDPSEEHIMLTLTGGGGFGKTTLAVALCHHPDVKDIFTNGFIFIELGSQPCNANVILNNVYCTMTRTKCEYGFMSRIEEKIKFVTESFSNILVIIDDVWETDVAKTIIRAFSNCKIMITTRIADIAIPTRKTIDVGPMTLTEAVHLMTDGIVQYNTLPKEDVKTIDELAKNAYQWPLLLSLIRGQLDHSLRNAAESTHTAIQNVQIDLLTKGLAAFDANSSPRSRHNTVQACIEVSLNKLDNTTRNKLISLILFTGIGGSIPKEVLHCLWCVSKQKARNIIDDLGMYGLVSKKNIQIPPHYCSAQNYLTIHAVISEYILSTISSKDVAGLSPFVVNTEELIAAEAELVFMQHYGMNKNVRLTKTEYLMYNKQKLEYVILPYYVKDINQHVLHDPHLAILILQNIKSFLNNCGHELEFFKPQIVALITDCRDALSSGQKLSRKYNMHFQMCRSIMKFDNLVTTLTEYEETPFINSVIVNCIKLTENIASRCDGQLNFDLIEKVKEMKYLTKDYHAVSSEKLPRLQLYTKLHSDITIALHKKCPDNITSIHHYLSSGTFEEDVELVTINYEIKLQNLNEPSNQTS